MDFFESKGALVPLPPASDAYGSSSYIAVLMNTHTYSYTLFIIKCWQQWYNVLVL